MGIHGPRFCESPETSSKNGQRHRERRTRECSKMRSKNQDTRGVWLFNACAKQAKNDAKQEAGNHSISVLFGPFKVELFLGPSSCNFAQILTSIRTSIRDLVKIRAALFCINPHWHLGFGGNPCCPFSHSSALGSGISRNSVDPTFANRLRHLAIRAGSRGHADPRWRPYWPPVKDHPGLARANSLKLQTFTMSIPELRKIVF